MLRRDTLLDTGAIVGLLVRRDQWHQAFLDTWPEIVNRCVTTEAVLTEASHLVVQRGGTAVQPLELLLSAEVPIFALHLPAHRQCVHLMKRYADAPMDYADATLVTLADALDIRRVFTTDRRGFGAYRPARGVPFEILP